MNRMKVKKSLLIILLMSVCFGTMFYFLRGNQTDNSPKGKIGVEGILVTEITMQDIIIQRVLMGTWASIQGKVESTEMNEEEERIEQYYGTYQITEFWGSRSFKYMRDFITIQEADMLLGRIIEINKDLLVTWDCFRYHGWTIGLHVFEGNYMVDSISIDAPRYEWVALDSNTRWYEDPEYIELRFIGEERCKTIEGKISIQITDTESCYRHEYYVTGNGIIMYSWLTSQYFYLEKTDAGSERTVLQNELTDEETERILGELYGIYEVKRFLPTKFYPVLDSNGDIRLPKEEADMMIGKEIVIGEDLYVTYDNLRLPNSEFRGRAMDEFCLETIEILEPDYQIQEKLRDDIFGLRDEMLPDEMEQEQYIEISVYPGYGSMDKTLPQLYLLDDGRMLMYAMGEYFLIEKKN